MDKETLAIINEFIDDLRSDGRSETTLKSYNIYIKKCLREIDKKISDITPMDILKWLKNNGRLKSSSYNRIIAILNVFFKHCKRCGYISKIPIKRYWKAKTERGEPKHLKNEEYSKLIRYIEKLPLRNRLIIMILFDTGIRRNELTNLNIEDINLTNRTFLINGKGRKERIVEISAEVCCLLRSYLLNHPTNIRALFYSNRRCRLSNRAINKVFWKVSKELGLEGRFHPHVGRHTFAYRQKNKGKSMEIIKNELGHENLSTTDLYVSMSDEEFYSTYRRIMG